MKNRSLKSGFGHLLFISLFLAFNPVTGAGGRSATVTVAAKDASLQFKADADYVCDQVWDEVEINAAINSLPLTGGKILLSEGRFKFVSSIGRDYSTLNNRGIVIEGQGKGSTFLEFKNSDGIKFIMGDGDNFTQCIDIRNLSIEGDGAQAVRKTAIYIEGTTALRHVTIDNVIIKPQFGVDETWGKGIVLKKIQSSLIHNVHITGQNCNPWPIMKTGIEILDSSMEVTIDNVELKNIDVGIYIHHDAYPHENKDLEGIRIKNPVLFWCSTGIEWSTPNAWEVDLSVQGGHMNTLKRGVKIDNIHQFSIEGTTIYRHEQGVGNTYIGIEISNRCKFASIRNCKFVRWHHPSPEDYDIGIYMDGQASSIIGNNINGFYLGVLFDSNSSDCLMTNNVFCNNVADYYENQAHNIVVNNNISVESDVK